MIGDTITITIVRIGPNNVRIGIEAPPGVPVHREEVYNAIKEDMRRGVGDDNATPGVLP